MRKILAIMITLLLLGCTVRGDSPRSVKVTKRDIDVVAKCIVEELDAEAQPKSVWEQRLWGDYPTHYIERMSNGAYEVRYRGSYSWFSSGSSSAYYVTLAQVDDLVFIEQRSVSYFTPIISAIVDLCTLSGEALL